MSSLDLHLHTSVSNDADYSPAELLALAQRQNVRTLAVTDHNSVRAVAETMKQGRQKGIRVIPGIEIDCQFEGVNLHMTAYGIRIDDPRYAQLEQFYVQQQRHNSIQAVRQVCEALQIQIPSSQLEALSVNGVLVPEDLAGWLLRQPQYMDAPWLKPYRPSGSRADNPHVNFYWDYFAQGKPGYVPSLRKNALEILALIHQTAGKAAVAHPGINFRGKEEVLVRLLKQGVDALEVYSSYHSQAQTMRFHQLALEIGVMMTAGSDFHGHHKPAIDIGGIPWLDDETEVERFLNTLESVS